MHWTFLLHSPFSLAVCLYTTPHLIISFSSAVCLFSCLPTLHPNHSNFTADFFKNGHHIGSSSTGNLTIHEVYKTDVGFYKCNISGGGESLVSWLAVSLPCLTFFLLFSSGFWSITADSCINHKHVYIFNFFALLLFVWLNTVIHCTALVTYFFWKNSKQIHLNNNCGRAQGVTIRLCSHCRS